VPRFIYRVYSDTSAGDNSEAGFLAHALSGRVATKYGLEAGSRHCRLEDVERADMRIMLSDHLSWKKRNGAFESRFISVTTSPLFALQLAVQKNARMKREERLAKKLAETAAKKKTKEADKKPEATDEHDGDEESGEDGMPRKKPRVNVPEGNIYICIMDTSQLPKGTVLYKANALVRAYENGNALTQNPGFLIAEYLVWEILNADACHVPFDLLLQEGFMTLFDDFTESPTTLQTQVQRLRTGLFDYGPQQAKKRTPFPHKRFGIAIRLATSFSNKWQLPMFVAFLALCRRWHTDESIVKRAMQTIDGEAGSHCSV
jgi:hypothetical protein